LATLLDAAVNGLGETGRGTAVLRRDVIALIGAMVAWPLVVRGQQPAMPGLFGHAIIFAGSGIESIQRPTDRRR
jgi:hypothetical protein